MIFRVAIPVAFISLFIGASCSAAEPELVRVGGQGEVDFVLVPPELSKDAPYLKTMCRKYTRHHTDYFCKMLMWIDRRNIPKKLPMTDAQLNSQYGCYDFNLSTGLNRLRLMKRGTVVQEL